MNFIELFIMVILPLAITFLIIANRLDSINEEIKTIKDEIMDEKTLREYLKEHLSIQVWCDYDGCDSPQVNIGLYLDDEEICISSDYLNT